MTDTYNTIAEPSEGTFKDRGSRFLAYAFSVWDEEEIKSNLEDLQKLHSKARHHCYAWRLGTDGNLFRANDDGEPSGTAGRPILGQIDSFGLTNVIIVVIRYFGGTKLGTSGLINAYREAAKQALESAETVEKTIDEVHEIEFEYLVLNEVMTLIKSKELEVLDQDLQIKGRIRFAIRQSESEELMAELNSLETLHSKFIRLR